MRFFIDTADVNEIREANDMGIICGVTTNPSLIAKEGRDFNEVIKEITSIVDGPISGEVKATTTDAAGMIAEGREIAAIHPNMVVKIPMTAEGLKAVKVLHSEGIKTNVTLVFSAAQALLAARAGATYVSPFLGRLDDISMPGIDLIRSIAEIFAVHDIDCQIAFPQIDSPSIRKLTLKSPCPAVIDLQQIGPWVLSVRHPAGHMNIVIEQFNSGEHRVSGDDTLSGFIFHLIDRTILPPNDSLSRLALEDLGFDQFLVRKADMLQSGHCADFSSSIQFPPERLLADTHKVSIQAALGHQFLMGAPLNDVPAAEDQNLISVPHRVQAVGDHDERLSAGQGGDGCLQLRLILRVHAGGGFVQNHNGSVLQHGPGNGDALLFPTRE